MIIALTRGASPLGLPYTLSRAPLRRRAPFAWLARALARDAARVGSFGCAGLNAPLDPARHVSASVAVLPGAGVAVAVEEHPDGERADAGNAGVGHHDHRRVAAPAHRHDDRQRGAVDAAAIHLRVEPPEIAADLLDAEDVVTIRARRTVLSSRDGERPDEAHVAHAVGELPPGVVERGRVDDRADAEPSDQPAAGKQHQSDHRNR